MDAPRSVEGGERGWGIDVKRGEEGERVKIMRERMEC